MSSRVVRRLILWSLPVIAAVGLGFGVAGAVSVDEMLSAPMQPSAAPSLLAPITEVGRTGWACRPEHAAGAKVWREAELPSNSAQQ